jgi:hypothetical protein
LKHLYFPLQSLILSAKLKSDQHAVFYHGHGVKIQNMICWSLQIMRKDMPSFRWSFKSRVCRPCSSRTQLFLPLLV